MIFIQYFIQSIYTTAALWFSPTPTNLNPPVILCQLGLNIVYYVCYFV